MKTIHLGVTDLPYAAVASAQQMRTLRWRRQKPWPHQRVGSATTGDVAQILEAKYSLFSLFVTYRGDDIVTALEKGIQGQLDNLGMGAPVASDPLAGATSQIEQVFREFLDNRELDGKVPGVPTKAAMRGVNHRLKNPYSKNNPPRPSFEDTLLLRNSMKAWTE